jgi:hypothetical protein
MTTTSHCCGIQTYNPTLTHFLATERTTLLSSKPEPQDEEKHHDDIDDMASALLDDTSDDEIQLSVNRHITHFRKRDWTTEGDLAQYLKPKPLQFLPDLPFNGDGTLAVGTISDATAASHAEGTYINRSSEATSASPPSIPRKSSKRTSARPITILGEVQLSSGDEIQPKRENVTQYWKDPAHTQSSTSAGNNTKSIRGSSKSMRNGSDQDLLQGPYVPKRNFLDGKKLLGTMKSAIHSLDPRRSRTRRDSSTDERLLNPVNNELLEWDEIEARFDDGGKVPLVSPRTCTNYSRRSLRKARSLRPS